ncbi:hypothetical protein HDV05_002988, partial [Chytridiales sp. JEL 0842]
MPVDTPAKSLAANNATKPTPKKRKRTPKEPASHPMEGVEINKAEDGSVVVKIGKEVAEKLTESISHLSLALNTLSAAISTISPASKTSTDDTEHEEDDQPKKKPRKQRAKRDPDMPKQPLTAYLFFLAEKRQELKDKGEKFSMSDFAARWSAMSDKQKEKYVELHNQAKESYMTEMETYIATHPEYAGKVKKEIELKKAVDEHEDEEMEEDETHEE